MVSPAWQGTGLGSALQKRMVEHARERGLRGFVAEVLPQNARMVALARACSENITVEKEEGNLYFTMLF